MAPDGTIDSAQEPDARARNRRALHEQEALWAEILKLAAVVSDALTASVRALGEPQTDQIRKWKAEEDAIDRWEVRNERECLRILTLYDPVASDLRRLVVVLKINQQLERISDLAARIARRSRKLIPPLPPALVSLAEEASARVRDSVDALTRSNVDLARAVITADSEVDRLYRTVRKELKASLRQDPDHVKTWLRLLNTARNLERCADHASKIAEALVYLKDGDIIRHTKHQPPTT